MINHVVVVEKGNCVACGLPIDDKGGLFLCAECVEKQKENEQQEADDEQP